jgi:putative exosortase-associated protein (TIGR04073 family)
MKKIILVISVCLFSMSLLQAADTPPQQTAPQEEEKDTAYRIKRGFSNILFGWMEIPRNIVMEDEHVPGIGMFYGLLKGPAMMVWRTGSGIVDVLSFGQSGPGLLFNQIPDTIKDASWRPDFIVYNPIENIKSRIEAAKMDAIQPTELRRSRRIRGRRARRYVKRQYRKARKEERKAEREAKKKGEYKPVIIDSL